MGNYILYSVSIVVQQNATLFKNSLNEHYILSFSFALYPHANFMLPLFLSHHVDGMRTKKSRENHFCC